MSRERAKSLFDKPADNPRYVITADTFKQLLDILYDDLDTLFADLSKDLDDVEASQEKLEKSLSYAKSYAEFKKKMRSPLNPGERIIVNHPAILIDDFQTYRPGNRRAFHHQNHGSFLPYPFVGPPPQSNLLIRPAVRDESFLLDQYLSP